MPLANLIRILIVDDHPVVRAGLTSMLGTQAELSIIGSAPSGEAAMAILLERDVDVVLLDLPSPGHHSHQL
jgi:DNA-binding NarL/FixJ family response regulator